MGFLKKLFGAKREEGPRTVEEEYAVANANLRAMSLPRIAPPKAGDEAEMLLPILASYSSNEIQRSLKSLPTNEHVGLLRRVAEHGASLEKRLGNDVMERFRSQREPLASPQPAAFSSTDNAKGGPVRYRGLTFVIGGEYSLVWDDKRIVRGIWYRDRNSVKNAARNRMVVAAASSTGFTVLDSDYETTIVGGIGGVEDLNNPGGAILWFASTREIFGQ